MSGDLYPYPTDHPPNWSTGQCRTCVRPWPCIVTRALFDAHFLGAPKALRAHMEWIAANTDPRWHDQIMGWLPADNDTAWS